MIPPSISSLPLSTYNHNSRIVKPRKFLVDFIQQLVSVYPTLPIFTHKVYLNIKYKYRKPENERGWRKFFVVSKFTPPIT